MSVDSRSFKPGQSWEGDAMFRNLSPWEGRLALLMSLILPLAFSAGCENPPCVDGDCAGDDDAVNDDDDGAEDFSATLHIVVPYGWTAHSVKLDGELQCSNADECLVEVDEPGLYRITMYGVIWSCGNSDVLVSEDDAGQTIVLDEVWEGTRVCSLTPDGTYGTFNVSSGAGWIGIGGWEADATYNVFFRETEGETEDYLLEGEIAEDLSWIEYYLGAPGTSGGDRTHLPLTDED